MSDDDLQEWLENVFPEALAAELYQPPGPHTLHCDCRAALYHTRFERRRLEAEVARLTAELDKTVAEAQRLILEELLPAVAELERVRAILRKLAVDAEIDWDGRTFVNNMDALDATEIAYLRAAGRGEPGDGD